MLERITMPVGPLACNCSIVFDRAAGEAAVIDPGDEWGKIRDVLDREKLKLKTVIHTHAHFDHCGATSDLKKALPGAKLTLHKDDEFIYQMLPQQGQMFGFEFAPPPPIDHFIVDEEEIEIGSHKVSILHTPGHSPGGVCIHCAAGVLADTPVVFSGDSLFQMSIGRTDLWGANHGLLLKSIKERLFTLDDETFVMPGHGGSTKIGFEKRGNPFLT